MAEFRKQLSVFDTTEGEFKGYLKAGGQINYRTGDET
jgi:hypothetical protein